MWINAAPTSFPPHTPVGRRTDAIRVVLICVTSNVMPNAGITVLRPFITRFALPTRFLAVIPLVPTP